MRKFAIITVILCVANLAAQTPTRQQEKPFIQDYVKAVVVAPPATPGVDPFYKKYADAMGISVLSSEKVPDAALLVARDIIIHMLAKRPELRAEMVKKRMKVGVMAQSESTTDIPEHRNNKRPGPNDPRLTPGEKANYDKPGGIASQTDKEYW
ncbi:MAG: glycoside hydrolase, partial [Acidobacteriota bacterium]|nr:glycoside hydrolase [Acidobacteriota bacterium]